MTSPSSPIHNAVRSAYGRIAQGGGGCCGPTSSCCGGGDRAEAVALGLGYDPADLAALPEGANLGLSCGNPTALASLRPGEVVVDLGSGAGLDVLIAARKIGPEGRAIGVDMTPQMLANARRNAAAAGAANAEFRLGEIENLPVADGSVDVVISNCVINLSPDKPRVFQEIARVLRPGGRVAVSDLALLRPLPEAVREDMAAYVGCVAGAVLLDEYVGHMRGAGLVEIEVEPANPGAGLGSVQDHLYQRILSKLPSGTRPEDFVASVRVQARKPEA